MTPEGQAHKSFYDQRVAAISGIYALLNGQASDEVKQSSFSATTALWDAIKAFTVETLPAAIAAYRVRPGSTELGRWRFCSGESIWAPP